ncbi:MAG: GDP-mannose 4,6-dehydratase [Actinobacteria bacterium]|nr:GDP-mannose 4,6-dehydratase [Actinomycetota bacterium]
MRALVTGGKGFVGKWLVEHLRDSGDEVVVIDKETDVANAQEIGPAIVNAAPDVVYHLAALSHVGESWDSPSEVLRVNVLGTAEVLAATRRSGGDTKVIVISSAEVYGSIAPEMLPVDETAPVAPVTPYAASKAAAEQVALQAWRGYGQPVVVARPFNHVGPGQAPSFAVSALSRRIVEAALSGAASIAVGTLSTRRDFTDVRDVVRAYRWLAEVGAPGETYNVCSGRDVAILDIAEALLKLSSADLKLVTDESLVRPVDVPVLCGDPTRISELAGWKPEIPLEETLRDVISYWRDHVTGR